MSCYQYLVCLLSSLDETWYKYSAHNGSLSLTYKFDENRDKEDLTFLVGINIIVLRPAYVP